jgi:hypothetical protein
MHRPVSSKGASLGRLQSGRSRLFVVESAYLVALAVVFIAYQISDAFRDAVPSSLGALPVGVPWFGAVGGTLISLTGIFKHPHDWKPSYELWHYARPLIGAPQTDVPSPASSSGEL